MKTIKNILGTILTVTACLLLYCAGLLLDKEYAIDLASTIGSYFQ